MLAAKPRLFKFLLALSLSCDVAVAQECSVGAATDSVVDCVSDCVPETICFDSVFSDCACDLWTRPTLTGDWGGLRTELQKSGITFTGQSTQFGFGVSGGVNGPAPPPA